MKQLLIFLAILAFSGFQGCENSVTAPTSKPESIQVETFDRNLLSQDLAIDSGIPINPKETEVYLVSKTKADAPIIVSPEEGSNFDQNATIKYKVVLPPTVSARKVSGMEISFQNSDGTWDSPRFIFGLEWTCNSCHQEIYDRLMFRIRLVFTNGKTGAYATSWHSVGNCEPVAPIITSPPEGSCYSQNATIPYGVSLPAGVSAGDVSGIEISFKNPDGSWDAPRSISGLEWTCYSCHQDIHTQLYWRVRFVFTDGSNSDYATSWHSVGNCS